MNTKKLFAAYLGGKARGATLEVHDVAFAVGTDIKSTLPQLRERWFGTPESLHVDSWMELSSIDGYRVELHDANQAAEGEAKLYFVNIGSYSVDRFGENHRFYFMAGDSLKEVKQRAKDLVATLNDKLPHADNLFEVDSAIEIAKVHGLNVVLKRDEMARATAVTSDYWPIAARA